MKVALAAMCISAASADLSLTWSDCGNGATAVKITGFEPSSLPLGQKTRLTGHGTTHETVTDATFDLEMTADKWGGAKLLSCNGKADQAKKCKLLMDVGELDWDPVKFPISPGPQAISVDMDLSKIVPSQFATTTTNVTATDSNGKQIFCLQIKSAPGNVVHPERASQISKIQNTPNVLWQAAPHPRFASQAPGASRDMMGVKGDQKKAVADLVAQGEIVLDESANSNSMVPDSFDSEQQWPQCAKIIGDIRDQSNCGCCWAFAGAEAGSDRMCIATNASLMLPLSAQDVCFNGGGFMSQGCNGGQITSPWSYLKKGGLFGGKGAVSGGQYQGSGPFGKGFCSDFSLPHCHHHGPQGSDPYPAEGKPGCPHENSPSGPKACDADSSAPHNDFATDKYSYEGSTVTASGVDGIQKAIMAGGPMSVAFTVYSDFENYAGGIYHHVTGEAVGGHAVKVVGWGAENGVKYWKIANSWNPYWGEKGYFRIKMGEGGIDDQAVGSSPDAKWSRAGDSIVLV